MSEAAHHAGPDAGTIARLGSQRAHYKNLSRTATKERDDAVKERDELRKQLDEAKKSDQSGRVKELEGQLRTMRHRTAFDRIARERGADAEALDDLFGLLKYEADSDEPDEGKIGKLLDDAAKHPSRSRFFAKADEGDDQAGDEKPAAKRPAGGDPGRGARHKPEGSITITRAQLADPKFMLDPANRAKIAGAKIRD